MNDSLPEFNGTQAYSLTFKPRVFAIGYYIITINLTIPEFSANLSFDSAKTTSSSTFISVLLSPLVACINDYTLALPSFWDNSFNLTLDSSCSHDPNLWDDEDQALSFQWSCYRACESAPSFEKGQFVAWNPNTNSYKSQCAQQYVFQGDAPQSFSDTGCFLPFNLHKSGPLTSYTLENWQVSNPATSFSNPMFRWNQVIAARSPQEKFLWVYYLSSDNQILTLNSYTLFYKTQHFFIVTVFKKSDPVRL